MSAGGTRRYRNSCILTLQLGKTTFKTVKQLIKDLTEARIKHCSFWSDTPNSGNNLDAAQSWSLKCNLSCHILSPPCPGVRESVPPEQICRVAKTGIWTDGSIYLSSLSSFEYTIILKSIEVNSNLSKCKRIGQSLHNLLLLMCYSVLIK